MTFMLEFQVLAFSFLANVFVRQILPLEVFGGSFMVHVYYQLELLVQLFTFVSEGMLVLISLKAVKGVVIILVSKSCHTHLKLE